MAAKLTKDEVKAVVAQFTREYWNKARWNAGQMFPGADVKMPHLPYDSDDELFAVTMEPQEWLSMALYGQWLTDEDPEEMYAVCQGMIEWLFTIPGMTKYEIPDLWKDAPMGALWWAAYVRAAGDELMTMTDAAKLVGVSVQAISQRADRGTLKSFSDPSQPNSRRGGRKVLRSEVVAAWPDARPA